MDPNSKPRSCLFCGRKPPEVRITKEHIYRRYFRERVETEDDQPRTATLRVPPPPRGPSEPEFATWEQSPWERTSKNVCHDCNNDFLNGSVETPAEADLLDLILGRATFLEQSSLARIALWAAKTAIVRTSIEGPEWTFDKHARHILDTQQVPPTMTIWLGVASDRTNINDRVNMVQLAIIPSRYTLTTMWIGHMVLYVLDCNSIAPLMMLDNAARAAGSDLYLTRIISPYGPSADTYDSKSAYQLNSPTILEFSDALRFNLENS